MTGETLEPTRGKLERSLSQGIQALYRSQLGQQTSQAVCYLLDDKLIVVIENGLTQQKKSWLRTVRKTWLCRCDRN